MSDHLTKEQIHRNMSAIRAKNTKPELLVRKFLFSRGFRYRLNHPRLPGHHGAGNDGDYCRRGSWYSAGRVGGGAAQ